jgi:hypothetical protein
MHQTAAIVVGIWTKTNCVVRVCVHMVCVSVYSVCAQKILCYYNCYYNSKNKNKGQYCIGTCNNFSYNNNNNIKDDDPKYGIVHAIKHLINHSLTAIRVFEDTELPHNSWIYFISQDHTSGWEIYFLFFYDFHPKY